MRHGQTIFCTVVAAWLLPGLAGLLPAAEAPQTVTGRYSVIARGHLSGSGHAAVGAQSVTLNLKVTDPAGNEGTLVASNLKMEGNRFSGTATALGLDLIVYGRVDAAGSNLRAARITCTYSAGEGRGGRIVGERGN